MSHAGIPALCPTRHSSCAGGAFATTAGLATALLGAFVQSAAPSAPEPGPADIERAMRWVALPSDGPLRESRGRPPAPSCRAARSKGPAAA